MNGRRKLTMLGAAVLVGAMLVAWLAPPSLAQTQIRILDREGPYERFVDVGKPGFSPGDTVLESHPLLDASDQRVVGRSFTRFTILRVLKGGEDLIAILDLTVRLTDGDISLYGPVRFSELFSPGGATFSVVGTTGAYDGMTGSANAVATDTEGEFLVTIDLIG